MLSILGIYILLADTIFKINFITPLQFTTYAIILGVVNIIMGINSWEKQARNLMKLA